MFWWIFLPMGNLAVWLLDGRKYGDDYYSIDEYFEILAEEGKKLFRRDCYDQ